MDEEILSLFYKINFLLFNSIIKRLTSKSMNFDVNTIQKKKKKKKKKKEKKNIYLIFFIFNFYNLFLHYVITHNKHLMLYKYLSEFSSNTWVLDDYLSLIHIIQLSFDGIEISIKNLAP